MTHDIFCMLINSTNIEVSPSESAILLKKLLKSLLSILIGAVRGRRRFGLQTVFVGQSLLYNCFFVIYLCFDILFVLAVSKKMSGFNLISFS